MVDPAHDRRNDALVSVAQRERQDLQASRRYRLAPTRVAPATTARRARDAGDSARDHVAGMVHSGAQARVGNKRRHYAQKGTPGGRSEGAPTSVVNAKAEAGCP